MNIKDVIEKDLPDFSGICVMETVTPLSTIRDFGISLAWKFNLNRGKSFKKILIAGGKEDRGKYFIADISDILTTNEVYKNKKWRKAVEYHEDEFGDWITARIKGTIVDNILNERLAIIFEKPGPIKFFSTKDFQFNSNPVYYKVARNNIARSELIGNQGERILIKNAGKIKSADITLNGLTVIAGVNDTGKSTVGKLMFAIVKAISRYEQDLNESKEKIVLEKIEKLYFRLRRFLGTELSGELLRDEFYPKNFLNQLRGFIETNQRSIFPELDIEQLNRIFENKQNLLSKLPSSIEKECVNILQEIKGSLIKNENKKEQMKRALSRALFSEFQLEISPKNNSEQTTIEYKAGATEILKIKLSKNQIAEFETFEELMFRDVVYIETPLFLQMYDLIQSSDTMFESDGGNGSLSQRLRPKISLHIKDLILKIDNAKYFANTIFEGDFEYYEALKNISAIIKGGFIYDNDKKEFVFTQKVDKKANIQIKPVNTASGIKSFGLIQLLLQGNMLNDTTLLIIDEPENHLHPKWQVEYARVMIELVKNDIFIIINSHSPYMIQALRYFSEKEKIEDKVTYHFAEISEGETQSVIKNVTDDLNLIFSKLAEPLKELVWQ